MHDRTGPWHIVLFTGDLTQSGGQDQFVSLTKNLEELWRTFAELGSSPTFVCVPGNHDLARPDKRDPGLLLLRRWWEEPEIHEELWNDGSSIYKRTLDVAFNNFSNWRESLGATEIRVPRNLRKGYLPGDVSTSVDTPLGPVGIVGLNSSWLQLDGSNYEGQLLVDTRQFHAVTSNEPEGWCREHQFNFLLTHHPVSWLRPEAKDFWQSEINPPGLFDLHLYGHMHAQDVVTQSHGGGSFRKSIQAASIFGLEHYGSSLERRHGYLIGKVTALGRHLEVRMWPRRAELMQDGSRRLVPDSSLNLEDESSFVLPSNSNAVIGHNQPAASTRPSTALLDSGARAEELLEKARYYGTRSLASRNVRSVEKSVCSSALAEVSGCWVGAEWGAGFEGFISALQDNAAGTPSSTYRIDLAEYDGKEEFFVAIKQAFGVSFQTLCDALSAIGPAYLILDDIPARQNPHESKVDVAAEIEGIVEIIKQYCPDLKVLLHTRHLPPETSLPQVALKPLDEADLRTYVADHPNGGERLTNPDAISALFSHTDGMPARIDTALRDLELVTIDQLASINRDLKRIEGVSSDVPIGVAKAVSDIAASEEPNKSRANRLLKALSAFPQGETLERIKRFDDKFPFYASQALELMSRSLITTSSVTVQTLGKDEPAKLLLVPRPVRDFVRDRIGEDELWQQTKRAATLYFGSKWAEGKIQPSLAARFRDPIASAAELANASAIIVRLINEATDRGDKRARQSAWRIANTYIGELSAGNHYRNVVATVDYLLAESDDAKGDALFRMKYHQGRCLRMLGKRERAYEVLKEVAEWSAPNSLRQSLLLSLAMTQQSLGKRDEAIETAKQAIKLGAKTVDGLQARTIILEETADSDVRESALLKHEATCRKKGAIVTANNIALQRVRFARRATPGVMKTLDVVLDSSAKDKDFYNGTRAIIKKAQLIADGGDQVTDVDKARLINAYQFLFNERLSNLFDDCHSALWTVFSNAAEVGNLLRLFRHSSLIWRLSGNADIEHRCLEKLAQHSTTIDAENARDLNRERAYYKARAALRPPSNAIGLPVPQTSAAATE